MGCLVRLLVALVVLAGLFVVGDVVARSVAERQAEKRLRESVRISGPAQVRVHGFPFLLQVARMRFGNVEVSGGEVGNGQLRLSRFEATLHGVRPRQDRTSARVDTLDGSAFLSFADLLRALPRQGVTMAPGGDDRVRVTGTVNVLGRSVRASADSRIVVVDGETLMVRATDIDVPGLPASSRAARAVASRLDFTVPIRGLPAGVRLVGVRTGQDGITAEVRGQDVLLQG